MKTPQKFLKTPLLRTAIFFMAVLFTASTSYGDIVTNLKGVCKNGQVFLTWTNPTGSKMQYNIYRSTSKFTTGSQLTTSKFMGFVRDNSAQNIQLSTDLPGDVYYKIDDAGLPLQSTQGLYVVTCTSNQPYFYAVTVTDLVTGEESKTVTTGKNSLTSAVNESVAKAKPVFQQTVSTGNETKDYYTQFVNNQETALNPAMNSTGSFGFNFYITKRGTAGLYPLMIVFEGAGAAINSGVGLDADITNCYVLGVYDWLPLPSGTGVGVGENAYYSGYHENFNIYSDANPIPANGTIKMYCQKRYIEAARWAKNNLPIDTTRVYTKGVSASGYGALLTALLYPDEISAVYASVEPMFVKPVGNKGVIYEQMWGESATNLPTDLNDLSTGLPLSIYEALDARELLNIKRDLNLPLIFDVHGKKDISVIWSVKIISWFDTLNANNVGGVFFWDQRTHGGDGKDYLPEETTPDFYKYQTNLAYPAFSNCSINQDPGNGSPSSGDKYGAYNGYLDWDENVSDKKCDFSVNVFIKDYYVGGVLDPEQYNTCKTDITFRRLQNFKPNSGETIKWKNFDNSNSKIQSGSFVYNGGLISLKDVTVNKSGNRIELKISGCNKTGLAGRLAEDAENEISIFGNGSSYSLEFTAEEEGNATITFFDLSGRMLRQDVIQYNQGINHFDLPKVGSGLFLVQVKAAYWSATEKIIFH